MKRTQRLEDNYHGLKKEQMQIATGSSELGVVEQHQSNQCGRSVRGTRYLRTSGHLLQEALQGPSLPLQPLQCTQEHISSVILKHKGCEGRARGERVSCLNQ